jgi:ATP-binding cassette subfamily F protein uup
LLLAKLFIQPANLLVLDEPTNDLDIETIELLEERLLDFQGTLLLVSHDRDFLDNVVTATIALDGKGGVEEYAGGCEDWLEKMSRPKEKAKPGPKPKEKTETEAPKKRKLLNKERQVLKELPKKIEQMEADRDRITASMQEPDYYRNAENDPLGDQQKLEELENKILEAYETWEELTELSES